MSDPCTCGPICAACGRARAAADPEGLDVERLARALRAQAPLIQPDEFSRFSREAEDSLYEAIAIRIANEYAAHNAVVVAKGSEGVSNCIK